MIKKRLISSGGWKRVLLQGSMWTSHPLELQPSGCDGVKKTVLSHGEEGIEAGVIGVNPAAFPVARVDHSAVIDVTTQGCHTYVFGGKVSHLHMVFCPSPHNIFLLARLETETA
jgi:hypothetical protein